MTANLESEYKLPKMAMPTFVTIPNVNWHFIKEKINLIETSLKITKKSKDVVISFEDWVKIQKEIQGVLFIESLRKDIRESMQEIAERKEKNEKPQTLKEFLDEC